MHPNEDVVIHLLEALKSGSVMDALNEYAKPDFTWRIVGEHTRSLGSYGVYQGIEGVMGLAEKIADYASDYSLTDIVSVTAGDKIGVSIHRSSAVSDGARFDTEEVYVWHFEDGEVSAIWDYNRIVHNQMVELGERGVTGY